MGTSTSSRGPGPGVPFDPPWLDQVGGSPSGDDRQEPSGDGGEPPGAEAEQDTENEAAEGIAPPRRFASARRELGDYARSGSREALGRAIGHYSRTGMGGARNAAARMRASTRAAAGLFSLLQSARDGSDPRVNEWVSELVARNPSAQDVINEIIQRVTSTGGSLDEESCKDSMSKAASELMEARPNINLLDMDDSAIWSLVELFLSQEACNRLHMDIGQLFESSDLAPRDVVARANEMREFMKAELSSQLAELRESTPNPPPRQLESVMRRALEQTFLVYEGVL